MANKKKAISNSPSYGKKKAAPSTSKKPVKKQMLKLDSKKIGIISDKINNINKRFETLIEECQEALKKISDHPKKHSHTQLQ